MSSYSLSIFEREGSKFWWARCYVEGEDGKVRRWSTSVDVGSDKRKSRKLAQRRAEEQAERLTEQLGKVATDETYTIKAVAKRLLQQKIVDGKRDRAVTSLGWQIDKYVLPYFGESRDVRNIRRADLEAFKAYLSGPKPKLRPTSINNALTGIRQILKHACEIDEAIETVPLVKNVKVDPDSKGVALTPEQIQALIDHVDPRAIEAKQFLIFLANTGLRKSECLAMRWGWIDWEARQLKIPAEYRKGGKKQLAPTPLNDAALGVLKDRQANGKRKINGSESRQLLSTGAQDRVWLQVKHDEARNSAAKRAKLGRVRNHDLRHSLGSLAYAAGASLPEVRDLLGHSTLAMVSRYAHTYEGRLRAVADRICVGVSAVSTPVSTDSQKQPENDQNRTKSRDGKKRPNSM